MPRELTFEPINVEDPSQKGKIQFESKIFVMDNGRPVYPDEETDFIYQKYSGFASEKFNTPDKRDFVKIQIDPEQESCIKLKNVISEYDESFEANRKIVFGKYDRLYKIGLSVKHPKEEEIISEDDDDNDTKKDEEKKVKLDSVKFKLNMAWFYYYENERLDKTNSNIIKKAVSDILQKNKNLDKDKKKALIGALTFKLKFVEDGKQVEKPVAMADIEQRKEIDTKVFFRNPTTIKPDSKKANECSEEELAEIYGEPKPVDVRTPSDMDKYYNYNCYIRFIWGPSCVWAAKNKDPDADKRRAGIKFVIKSMDIIKIPYENSGNSIKKTYTEYSFGKSRASAVLINDSSETIFKNISAEPEVKAVASSEPVKQEIEKVETKSKTETKKTKTVIVNSDSSADSNDSDKDSDSDSEPEPPKKGKKAAETKKTTVAKKGK
jgi:hypothetical protein